MGISGSYLVLKEVVIGRLEYARISLATVAFMGSGDDTGVDVSEMSDREIEAKYNTELKELMGDDVANKFKRIPSNSSDDDDNGNKGTKYDDDNHAIEPCEEFDSDDE